MINFSVSRPVSMSKPRRACEIIIKKKKQSPHSQTRTPVSIHAVLFLVRWNSFLLPFTICIGNPDVFGNGLQRKVEENRERTLIFSHTFLTSVWKRSRGWDFREGIPILCCCTLRGPEVWQKRRGQNCFFFFAWNWKSMSAEDEKQRNQSLCPNVFQGAVHRSFDHQLQSMKSIVDSRIPQNHLERHTTYPASGTGGDGALVRGRVFNFPAVAFQRPMYILAWKEKRFKKGWPVYDSSSLHGNKFLDKGPEAAMPWKNPGKVRAWTYTAPNRLADRKHRDLSTPPNPHRTYPSAKSRSVGVRSRIFLVLLSRHRPSSPLSRKFLSTCTGMMLNEAFNHAFEY